MSSQRYERVAADDADDHDHSNDHNAIAHSPIAMPNSPPPSFRSRASSRRTSHDQTNANEEERNLNDAFDAPTDDESDNEDNQTQRRLLNNTHNTRGAYPSQTPDEASSTSSRPNVPQRRVTEIPVFAPTTTTTPSSGRVYGGGNAANDGVWANLNAKPRPGDDVEEKPPTYEQAAADSAPPYWETTVLSPYSYTGNPDDVFVDSLLVGSLFSFVWNALISMSFQLIGFLLTYLLHTTHAAKHGSRAGLGITLVQYGFQMKYSSSRSPTDPGAIPGAPTDGVPADPNAHDFDPNHVLGTDPADSGVSTNDWLAYILMIVGWFILIRAVSDYMRARRQEALVRSSPDRGLGVAVVAEGESPETSA